MRRTNEKSCTAKLCRPGEGSPGSLYLVATPIGNLEDMTYRAVRILQECDIIAAEDTRQSRKPLTHFEIPAKPLFSYHEHNKAASGPEIIRYIIEGKMWHSSATPVCRRFRTLARSGFTSD